MTTATQPPKVAISPLGQYRALTWRCLRALFRNGEFVLCIVAPVFLAICFYLPLRGMMNQMPGMNYAQFLMPIIALQSVGFVATSAAMRSATDAAHGMSMRLRTMPIHPTLPTLARMTGNAVLLAFSLLWAVLAGLVIGWRPPESVVNALGFLAVTIAVGVVLAAIADAIGVLASSPEATSQALTLPQLVLGMVSTGFVPEERFPDWIRPFARNQPISQIVEAMRAFDDGRPTWDSLMPALLWIAGLVGLLILLVILAARKGVR